MSRIAKPGPVPPLTIRKVRGMGRGVFAARPFRKGEIIEICPVLRLHTGTEGKLDRGLECYVFRWGKDGTELVIALGYGSLYNHSPDANAHFYPRPAREEIVFRALRDIAVGEQILIDYLWEEFPFEVEV